MFRKKHILLLAPALLLMATGCKSHETKVADLQKQYDQLSKQYRQDCSGEMLDLPAKPSPKCTAEDKRVTEAWNQLQAERAKQQ